MELAALNRVLTATKAPLTNPQVSSTDCKNWADWLGIKTFNDPELIRLVEECAKWAKALKANENPRWLTILGESGTGKTHCAYKLFHWSTARFQQGRTVRRNGANYYDGLSFIPHAVYWPDFVQKLRAGESFQKREDMKLWPVLFLDDIGGERDTSGFAAEELHTLLGCRVGKWTLLTSNMTQDKLEALDGRLVSRIFRDKNQCVTVQAQDYALRRPF